MGGLLQFWSESDAIGRAVALMLLAMSVSAWVVILWKGWILHRARNQLAKAVRAFWAAESMDAGAQRLQALDTAGVLLPLLQAATSADAPGTLATQAVAGSQLTRRLRDALHASLARLQYGQVLLASIGSTSPFVGLFGTVWGIYHALLSISVAGAITIEKVAGPVGEALVMTAAGLAVAIPAVLAYNLFGKWVASCETELEGFAHDLRELLTAGQSPEAGSD
jgi:biopolymer transport protein ExbB